MSSDELPPSELGTKEYWDQQYLLEKKNFEEIGDRGEVWFGEGAMNRMIRWLEKNIPTTANIIDVGCGNGVMCIELYEVGFKNIFGVDYSSHAIELAQKIANENENQELKFKTCDILNLEPEMKNGFDICLDKGTYDAISLCQDNSKEMRLQYRQSVFELLREEDSSSSSNNTTTESPLFFITSCNWTENELVEFFSPMFQLKTVLPTPKFQFGGQTGNNTTSIVFQKKKINLQ